MPWVFVTMKEVLGCLKPRVAAKKRFNSGMSEWGNPIRVNTNHHTSKDFAFSKIHICIGDNPVN